MEAVFLKILNMSCCAADVIGVVLLVWLALWRAPKKWRYLLWIVVAFRLVCPVSFSAPFSVMRYAVQPAAVTQRAERSVSEITYIPQNIGEMAEPKVYVSSSPAVSEYVSQSLPRPLPWNSANPLQIYIPICAGLWCLGMASLLIYGAISYVNLELRLRGAVRLEDGVYETDAVRTPFILGLFRPTVYLPVGLAGEPLRYVLAHERFHIRRGDHAVKLMAFLMLCVHWFNPLVWLAYYLMSRDMEMRCDEAVLAAESGISKPYSMALLSFAAARRFPSPSPLCFGESGVAGRIKNVLRWKKPRVWVTALCALMCVATVAACAANPNKAEKGEPNVTPWSWTSTVRASDVEAAEWNGTALTADQRAELVRLLNDVRTDEVVRGRGIPSLNVLDIPTGVGYRLRWAGGIIELDFGDDAAAAALYGGAGEPGPGVWEIRSEALYAFLEGLETQTAAPAYGLAAPSDVTDWGEGFSADGHMYVRRYHGAGWSILIPTDGWTLEEASETRTKWVSDAGTGSTLVVRRASAEETAAEPKLEVGQTQRYYVAPDGEIWCVFTQFDPMLKIYSSWAVSEPELLQKMMDSFRLNGADFTAALGTIPTEESLRTLQMADFERYWVQVQRWNAEVDMLGETFVSEAGEEGNWQDIPSAFASRWCQKYLNAGYDSPYHCSDAGIWTLGDYMNAATMTGAPRRLAFNVTLALGLPAERVDAFVYARAGLVDRIENGLVYVSTEAVLVSDDGIHFTVEGMNSGGSAGWGWRELRDTEFAKGVLHTALEQREPYALLRYLPNMNWGELTDEEERTAMELLQTAAVSDDPAYLEGRDQLYRDLYMLWGLKRSDGAFAELYLDGPESILARQRRADPDAFAAALREMDAQTQALVRLGLGL